MNYCHISAMSSRWKSNPQSQIWKVSGCADLVWETHYIEVTFKPIPNICLQLLTLAAWAAGVMSELSTLETWSETWEARNFKHFRYPPLAVLWSAVSPLLSLETHNDVESSWFFFNNTCCWQKNINVGLCVEEEVLGDQNWNSQGGVYTYHGSKVSFICTN